MPTTNRPHPRSTSGPEPVDPITAAATRHRRELLVHCYRMTGSMADAEELVQETMLRAWRHRDRYEGRASMRTWLYRIATNACLDWLEHSARRVAPVGLGGATAEQVEWLQPIPDRVLDGGTDADDEPGALVVARETIELAVLAALQLLPPRQRAVFIARDLAGLSASDTADLMDTTVEASNSLVQRARATMRANRSSVDGAGVGLRAPTEAERDVLARYVTAHETGDRELLESLLSDDVLITMPPEPSLLGRRAVVVTYGQIFDPDITGTWRLVPVGANRQPTVACYLRRPGERVFRAVSTDLLRVEDGRIAEINCLLDPSVFEHFDLPEVLEPG